MTGRFHIDRAHLLNVVDQIRRFDTHLEEALGQADTKVDRLHVTWTGDAAAAHRAAHDKWKHGLGQMREALEEMRQNAMIAHDNYTSAAEANVSMWRQAR